MHSNALFSIIVHTSQKYLIFFNSNYRILFLKFFDKFSENYIAMSKKNIDAKNKKIKKKFHIFKIIDFISMNRRARIKQMYTNVLKKHHK